MATIGPVPATGSGVGTAVEMAGATDVDIRITSLPPLHGGARFKFDLRLGYLLFLP